jgi:transcriptional regulator NrdR family protein
MTCPKCGSQNLRHSRSGKWLDMFHRAARHEPFRCRDCRHRFYAVESSELAQKSTKHSHGPKPLISKRARRRLVEAVIFAAMLLLFLVFLRYLTREKTPASDTGCAPFAVETQSA